MKIFSTFLALLILCGCSQESNPQTPSVKKLENIGSYRREITSQSPLAVDYFNQGLALIYGHQYQDAANSFDQAIIYDPECAICYFGKALAESYYSPEESKKSLEMAQDLLENSTEVEKELTQALISRYESEDSQDSNYSTALARVYRHFPEDPDVAALYIDSLLTLQPSRYWTRGGEPLGVSREAKAILDELLTRYPNHLAANIEYVQLMKNSAHTKLAIPSAVRIQNGLASDLAYLAHTPSPIFLRLGDYKEAAIANEKAIEIEEGFQAIDRSISLESWYHLWYARSMEGKKKEALKAVRELNDPNLEILTLVQFEDWEAIKKIKQPPSDVPYNLAIWEFGQAMASLNLNDIHDAMNRRDQMSLILKDPSLKNDIFKEEYPLDLVKIAYLILEGEIASNQGDEALMKKRYEEAIGLEDVLPILTPPLWVLPARQFYGKALLCASKPFLAEMRFLEDLEQHPMNGRALYGLMQGYLLQGNLHSAHEIERHYEEAWKDAEKIDSSHFIIKKLMKKGG